MLAEILIAFKLANLDALHAAEFDAAVREWSEVVPIRAGGKPVEVMVIGDGPHPICGRFRIREYAHIVRDEQHRPLAIHFNAHQMCGDNAGRFYPVALHEIGHALGLGHLKQKRSIMHAEGNATCHLTRADKRALLKLHAAPKAAPVATYYCDYSSTAGNCTKLDPQP